MFLEIQRLRMSSRQDTSWLNPHQHQLCHLFLQAYIFSLCNLHSASCAAGGLRKSLSFVHCCLPAEKFTTAAWAWAAGILRIPLRRALQLAAITAFSAVHDIDQM